MFPSSKAECILTQRKAWEPTKTGGKKTILKQFTTCSSRLQRYDSQLGAENPLRVVRNLYVHLMNFLEQEWAVSVFCEVKQNILCQQS